MEEKKFDINSLIGFVLLGAIILWWMYSNQPTPEEKLEAEKNKIENVEQNPLFVDFVKAALNHALSQPTNH